MAVATPRAPRRVRRTAAQEDRGAVPEAGAAAGTGNRSGPAEPSQAEARPAAGGSRRRRNGSSLPAPQRAPPNALGAYRRSFLPTATSSDCRNSSDAATRLSQRRRQHDPAGMAGAARTYPTRRHTSRRTTARRSATRTDQERGHGSSGALRPEPTAMFSRIRRKPSPCNAMRSASAFVCRTWLM